MVLSRYLVENGKWALITFSNTDFPNFSQNIPDGKIKRATFKSLRLQKEVTLDTH